ncbi:MAG TPA: recombinase family protein [Gemmataceae bacterium]|nr:recombinase family protein [Gemmataceae bacterium]
MNRPHKKAAATLPLVRCAIYTRKSTEEGLEQEFNSLDAQRESAEAFIRSQTHEGWTCLPERYDDGGFTGGNMERPALQRLLADIQAGKIDCVVTYKVDRLSRSLLDFAKMMETFEQHGVSFVSITQQFNSATSMGRLILNVLLSFAQFEREIIAERTRDKMAATRRKGKWSGGTPVLGYDLDPRGRRLHVNEHEAERVRVIFALYLEHEALLPVVQELAHRGWVGKCWQTRHGRQRGGRPFDKTSLYRLLTNVLYVGKVRYKDEVHDGEQPALIDAETFGRVQALLQSHGPEVGPPSLHGFTALLKGLLRCAPCACAMTPSHTSRKGGLRYRYYTCVHAQKNGWQTCPSKSIPAQPMEQLVVEQIQRLGRDPLVLEQMLTQVRQQDDSRVAEWESERVGLERDLLRGESEVRKLVAEVGAGATSGGAVTRLAELQARLAQIEQRLARLRGQMEALQQERLDQAAVTKALSGLLPAWEAMTPAEQGRVVRLLVERVDYDGQRGKAAITFQPLGLKTLAGEMLGRNSEEQSA